MKMRKVRRNESTRVRRNRGNLTWIYLLVGVLVVLVFVILSLTVFFKLNTFIIEGDTVYTNDRIVSESGLVFNENLLRLDEETAEQNILIALPFIETVDVKIELPSTVKIKVTAAAEYAYLPCGDYCYIVNSLGRVLKRSDITPEDLIQLKGVAPPEKTLEVNSAEGNRTYLVFDDERTQNAFALLAEELSVSHIGKITRVEMSSYLDISFIVDNRVRVELGNMVDMDYKMKYVRKLFADENYIPKTGYAILDVSNTERVSLKTNITGNITLEDILGEEVAS